MRNQQRWLLLLLRQHSLARPHISRRLINQSPFQVNRSLRSITSSTIHSRDSHMLPYQPLTVRSFSTSELAVEHKDSDQIAVLTGIFSKPNRTSDEIKLDLESNNVTITHDLVIRALRSFNTAPDAARRFFNWLKNVITLRKAKNGRSKRFKATSNGFKEDDHSQKEPSRRTNGASVKKHKKMGTGILSEDNAAIRIQTAFRAYMARKTLRRLKGISRLHSMIQGPSVKKQASTTLSALHSWNRIQAEVRACRVRMVIEGRLKQKKLVNQLKLEEKLHNLQVEWNGGPETKEVVLSRIHQREAAAVKRERTMAYAFSHQWRANSNPFFGASSYALGNANWGWSWRDRWIAARPWECRIPVPSSPKIANRTASKMPKSSKTQTTKTPVSVKSTSVNWKRTIKPRKLSYEAADKLTAHKGINKVETSIDKQEVVS